MEISQTDALAAWMNAHSKLGIPDENFHAVPARVLAAFAQIILRDYQKSEFRDVRQFQEKFGHLVSNKPTHLTKRKLHERIDFISEERLEFIFGAGFDVHPDNGRIVDNGRDQDMGEMADALIDMVYVIKGTAVMMGLPWDKLWEDVQRANMAKVRGIGHRGNLVDCIKPEGWVPPKTAEILQLAGYEGGGGGFIDDEIHLASNGSEVSSNVA